MPSVDIPSCCPACRADEIRGAWLVPHGSPHASTAVQLCFGGPSTFFGKLGAVSVTAEVRVWVCGGCGHVWMALANPKEVFARAEELRLSKTPWKE